MGNESKTWGGPPPNIMDTKDLVEKLGQFPVELQAEVFKKMIIELAEYHRKCHENRLIMYDRLDRLIRNVNIGPDKHK